MKYSAGFILLRYISYTHCQIKDWFSDFWITHIYDDRVGCSLDIIAENIRDKGTRYNKCNKPNWKKIVIRDKKVLSRYIFELIKIFVPKLKLIIPFNEYNPQVLS
jgi:hypothetical protein